MIPVQWVLETRERNYKLTKLLAVLWRMRKPLFGALCEEYEDGYIPALLSSGSPLLCRARQTCHGVVLPPQAAVGQPPVCRQLHPPLLPVSKAPLQSAVITPWQLCYRPVTLQGPIPPCLPLVPKGKKGNRKLSEVIAQQMEKRASEDLRTIPDFPAQDLTLPAQDLTLPDLAARHPLFYTGIFGSLQLLEITWTRAKLQKRRNYLLRSLGWKILYSQYKSSFVFKKVHEWVTRNIFILQKFKQLWNIN